jgi:putative SOS response-associated peptidase YedK
MFGRNESESFRFQPRFRSASPMDRPGRPKEPQLVYRRAPETSPPVEGLLRWGLIPHFCETRPDFAPIHARAETVAEKEWFRDAYRRRRCVVPMNSFFQKDHDGKRHVISRRDGQPFGVAGIWENWREPLADKWERTFAVVTVPANELVAQMLAILPNDRFARWLSDEADPRELLVPFPADELGVSSATIATVVGVPSGYGRIPVTTHGPSLRRGCLMQGVFAAPLQADGQHAAWPWSEGGSSRCIGAAE